jgi:hypothetical protein
MYDRMYDPGAMDLVLPSLVMGQADALAVDLGRLCKRIQDVAVSNTCDPIQGGHCREAVVPLLEQCDGTHL